MSLVIKTGKEAVRFMNGRKALINPSPAIELIKQQPTKISQNRIVHCEGGYGPLGHPRVYINLDHGVRTCGYCGQTFKQNHSHGQ